MTVARRIAAELAEGRIRPGDLLSVEADSAEHYGVGRSTLREALRVLQYLGLVEMRMGRTGGIVLRDPTPENLAQILTLYLQFTGCTWRQLLEAYTEIKPVIVEAAARNRTDEQADELRSLLARFDDLSLAEQASRVSDLVKAYHAMSGNPMLGLMGRAFETVILSHSAVAARQDADLPAKVEWARLLAVQIADGNAETAVEVVKQQTRVAIALMEAAQPEVIDTVISWE